MSGLPVLGEDRCLEALRRHLDGADEATLHEAYEFGRTALAEGMGVLDMTLILCRAVYRLGPAAGNEERGARRIESFMLECLSPFEMAQRGIREANEGLRRLDERHEEHVRRVARELHDQAGQILAAVFLSLDGLRPHLTAGGEERFARMTDLLHQVEEEIRRLAHELRPVILDDLGLLPALRFLGESVAQRSRVSIAVTGSTGGRLPARIETELYRTAQEALTNVARHSRASRALIEVRRTRREVSCRVRDDGRGFDSSRAPAVAPGGLGLRGIRERLAPLGGALDIRSQPGKGTELLIRIPLEVSHAHTSTVGG